MTVDAVITGSHVISQNGMVDKNIVIDEGKIVGLTNDIPQCDLKIKADGLVSLTYIMVYILRLMKQLQLNPK